MRAFVLRLAVCGVLTAGGITHSRAETPPPSWPHTISNGGATLVVYQPQAVSWPDHKVLTARAAVAVTQPGASKPVLGTVLVSLDTQIDEAANMVRLSGAKVLETHFPSLDTAQATQLQAKLTAALAEMQTNSVKLENVLLSLKERPADTPDLRNDAPQIFHSDRPASLVVFDGEPVLAPVGNTGLSFAVNTNWDVFRDASTWYLLNNGFWLSAPAVTGPWKPVSRLPAAFNSLPADANFAEARKHIPARAPAAGAPAPEIFVSTRPAEIIVTEGPPQFAPVPDTTLQYAKNTDSTLFRDPANGKLYYLVSGRWFSAQTLDGPWSFVSNDLPPDFSLIPSDSKQAPVLASVPGTAPAQEAALEAQIPQQATLSRSSAKFPAQYAGAPNFQPIPGTAIRYAVNTEQQILEVAGKYYACYQGAWFVAPAPNGPWTMADSVPPAIYQIPPSSPMYNVTYVRAYSATPETVTYGYTAGYLMGFITAGLLVYGTGYYYPPYVYAGRVPIYFPYPYSYGANVWYNPATAAWVRGGTIYGPYRTAAAGGYYNAATGAWGRGAAVYGPYGGAGAWSRYNPTTGTYAHGSAVWGPNGGTAHGSFYNPRYGVAGSTTQHANAYARWGSSVVSGPNRTVNTASVNTRAGGATAGFSSSTGAAGVAHRNARGVNSAAVKGPGGDVYAGRDGNVYRHTSDGWSKWDNGSWNPVKPPANDNARTQNLSQNRQNLGGTQRTQSVDRTSWQQLQQDRFGRQYGENRYSGWREGGDRYGSEYGGGRFGGERGDFGGGRFRR